MTSVRGSSAQYCNEVVARDVGLVADRDEGRDPDVQARARSRGCARPSAPLCDDSADAALRADTIGAKVAFKPDGGVGVDEPHAVGPDHPHAGGAHLVEQGRFAPASLLAGLAEARP